MRDSGIPQICTCSMLGESELSMCVVIYVMWIQILNTAGMNVQACVIYVEVYNTTTQPIGLH